MDEEDTKFELLEIENLVESDDFTIFNQEDLPVGGFQVMEEIRRKGKLCDVTLKVRLELGEKNAKKEKKKKQVPISVYFHSIRLDLTNVTLRCALSADT